MAEQAQPTAAPVSDREALGLSVHDWRLINQAIRAWYQVPNGYFLAAPRLQKRAPALIERGYLTKAPQQPLALGSSEGWLVVVLTKENHTKLTADIAAARAKMGSGS